MYFTIQNLITKFLIYGISNATELPHLPPICPAYGPLASSFSEANQQGIGPYYYTEVVEHKLMYKYVI